MAGGRLPRRPRYRGIADDRQGGACGIDRLDARETAAEDPRCAQNDAALDPRLAAHEFGFGPDDRARSQIALRDTAATLVQVVAKAE